ncbi:hypothetical protein D3C73_1334090 [compost metagenome]
MNDHVRVVWLIEYSRIRGPVMPLHRQHMPGIDLADRGDGLLIKCHQFSYEIVLMLSFHNSRANGLVQQIIAAHDPAVAVPPGKLLP